ncbi:hypothetical protein E4U15_007612 [Claviceps sp. LM218 group G6]|nr:hypothetical protein E4U15_007612 [Claviceps sp. LM218 group G6]
MAKAAKLGPRWHNLQASSSSRRASWKTGQCDAYLTIEETPKTCRERGAAIGSQALYSRQVAASHSVHNWRKMLLWLPNVGRGMRS